MPSLKLPRIVWMACAVVVAAAAPVRPIAGAQSGKLAPLVYTIRFPAPASKTFDVEIRVPTDKRPAIDLMMPVWSPGFYGLQNYADRVTAFAAKAPDGTALDVTKPKPNRWEIQTGGRPTVVFTYTLSAPRGSNLSNGVTETSAVIIGPATFATLADQPQHPADLRLELPAGWQNAVTSLDAAPDGQPNHFVAPNYDVLVDSPIVAGAVMSSTEFTVGGTKLYWTYLGPAEWTGAQAVAMMKPLVEEHLRFWGAFPYKKYVFLNIVTGGGGGSGVEHLNSVAITTSGRTPTTEDAKFREAAFVSHEYFHAMNVKRLRPVELGPFNYEVAPTTTGLWVAEGLTSYFGDLLAERSGVGTPQDYLSLESKHISDLQTKQPGRLVQTIEQASSQMFERIPADKKVDYYIKGPVVGLVMDAHIRKLTNGKRSMDDVIKLEYQRWSGAHGYTEAEFDKTVSDAAGVDVNALLQKLIATTDEVDYTEMLDWFGLRFTPDPDPSKAWTLEVRADATAVQKAHFAAFMKP